ncbi:hypothetical protein EDC96DRAFT_606108 [Choanephora cucurbitarum]|nr:hypothetical protein EDC96DRAFT_606108 [Choanephora cucurbitarum]
MATQSQQRAANVVKGGKLEPLSQKNTINGLLSRSIKFRKSRYVDHKLEHFKQKFAPVNGVTGVVHAKTAHAYDTQTDMLVEKVDQYGFEQPMKVLFSKDKLSVGWQEIYPVGSGLKDMGHLSSLNAVLQVLTYTPALANFLMNRTHGANCTIQDYCFLCAVEEHVRTALKGSPYALQPRLLVGKLKKMPKKSSSKDAFDVWAYFMEQMQSFLLSERTSKDTRIQETTALYQMFGGYIQKKFTCPSCNALDHFYDSFLYLSLDLTQCSTVERCVSRHFKNKVSLTRECSSCQHEGQVECTQSIYRTPMNLVIQLDRFNQQSKNNKIVKFEERIDIRYAVTETERSQVDSIYQLYGIIVHTGESLHDGHYVAYVKSSNGIWYCMDNETVQVVSLKRLLEQNVYMLFYHNIPPKIVSAKKKPIQEPAALEIIPQPSLEVEEKEVEEKEVDIEDREKEDALRKAMEEASHKEKRENEAAIVVRHDETMQSKRDKLDALIQREEVESKSAEVKQMLLTKIANNQFQDEIDTWDTGVAQKRDQVLKQMKTKRKKVDSYDLDYDRGKLKKVKSKKKDDKFNKPNMFQLAADMKKKK